MIKKIRIGTRGSKLALWQANFIKNKIAKRFNSIDILLQVIQTEGDRDQTTSLTQAGGQGLFTKAIEQALLDQNIDLAIHSLKDLPSNMPDSLQLGAVPERGPVYDLLITAEKTDLSHLQQGATIASGSIRRRSQILAIRPDIKFADLRGNIETRLKKLDQHQYDGILMAEAAVVRLNLKNIEYYRFSIDEMLPAVGQGAIGVQFRKQDQELLPFLKELNDFKSFLAISSERAFLRRLDSGCSFPVAAHAVTHEQELTITGLVAASDGSKILKETLHGGYTDCEQLGIQLAENLLRQGAGQFIQKEA